MTRKRLSYSNNTSCNYFMYVVPYISWRIKGQRTLIRSSTWVWFVWKPLVEVMATFVPTTILFSSSLLCRLGLVFAYSIPCREVRHPHKKGTLGRIPTWIEWWGSSCGDMGSVVYLFMIITPMSTLTRSGSTWYW